MKYMKKDYDLQTLLERYRNGTATAEERALVESWFLQELEQEPGLPDEERMDRAMTQMDEAVERHLRHGRTRRLWPRVAAAASVLIALSAGGYLIFHKTAVQQVAQVQDIPPGHNQATLTLAGGQKITLTKGLNGKLAQQGNMQIGVNQQSAVAYTATIANTSAPVTYNTLSTAIGEQSPYPLILADGTKVWLDAASSITFPTSFNGKDRVVQLTGQAYFEVAHRAAQPFKISVRNLLIEDIGTQFNVNAYGDEPAIRTTLLQGAVRVTAAGQSVILQPGQAAIAAAKLTVQDGDTEESIAWKNGYFRFNDESIQDIMRQLARWYNIEVAYNGDLPTVGFNAHISRYKNISQVLKVLALTNKVQFKVIGRRVMVTQ